MELKEWLGAERGRHKELAAHLGLSPGRLSQMADDGVPTKYMLTVRDFTGGVVTLEEMVQERTPDREDGGTSEKAGA
jgi:DNA-binding transcriptional regulator YdaS (Cro superfamily)